MKLKHKQISQMRRKKPSDEGPCEIQQAYQ